MNKNYFFLYDNGSFKIYDSEYYISNKDSTLYLFNDCHKSQELLEEFAIEFSKKCTFDKFISYLSKFNIESEIDRANYDLEHLPFKFKVYILNEDIDSIIDEYEDMFDFIKRFIFEGKPFSDEAFYEGIKKLKYNDSDLTRLKYIVDDLIETYDYKAYCERFFQNIPINILKLIEDVRNGTIIS